MKEKYNFIFPQFVARKMKGVNQATTLLVSAVAVCFLLIAFTTLMIYRLIAFESGFFIEGFLILNLCACFIFLSSSMLTYYKQYKSLKEIEN